MQDRDIEDSHHPAAKEGMHSKVIQFCRCVNNQILKSSHEPQWLELRYFEYSGPQQQNQMVTLGSTLALP